MAKPWVVLDRVETDEGPLELRQRGERDFLITIGTQVLMNSLNNNSEVILGQLGCEKLADHPAPRVLVGGLGMGCTLRAVLDCLPPTAEVVVAELNPVVVRWCQGSLAPLTSGAVNDPRVRVELGDVAALVKRLGKTAPTTFDAVIFDLYRGPHPKTDSVKDPLYGSRAIANVRAILKPGGRFVIWGENYDAGFEQRLNSGGFAARTQRTGRGGYRHVVFIADCREGQARKVKGDLATKTQRAPRRSNRF